MPDAHVLLPVDDATINRARREPRARAVDGARMAGMPGSQQCEALLCREVSELEHLADSFAGRFFQQYVQAPLKRIVRDLVTRLWRSTERHRFKVRKRLHHR